MTTATKTPDLTLHETAKILAVSYQHLYNLASNGQFPPAYRIGKAWRVKCEELENFRDGKYMPLFTEKTKHKGTIRWPLKSAEKIITFDSSSKESRYTEALAQATARKH